MEDDKDEIAERLGMPLDHLKRLFQTERQEMLLRKAELTSKELLEIDLEQPNLEQSGTSMNVRSALTIILSRRNNASTSLR